MYRESKGHRKRLRERYLRGGCKALNDYEQLELLLTYAISRKDVKPIAKELLKRYRNFEEITNASMDELMKIEGIGEGSAIFFKFLGDITRDLFKGELEAIDLQEIDGTSSLVRYLRSDIGFLSKENFKVIYLNGKNRLLDDETMSVGTIDKASIYPREIVERALCYRAKSVIISHNHPSGEVKPSRSDIEITLKLKKTLEILEIRLLDHIIVSRDSYYSFLEEGILELGG